MQRVDLLILGDATDGPVGTLVPVRSLEETFRLFGGYSYFEAAIASGDTAATLPTAAWADAVQPLTPDADGELVPTRLFEFQAAGTALAWNALGAARTVVFRWAAQPASTSLLQGLLAAFPTGAKIAVARLGNATTAAVSLSGFTLQARYPGARYNGTTLAVSGAVVTVTPAPGTGRVSVYRPASDRALAQALTDDAARGRVSLRLTGTLSLSRLTLPSGSYVLTGGQDTVMTAGDVQQFFGDEDLAGVDVCCPAGILTPDLSGAGLFTTLSEQDYPTLLVAQAPASGDALANYAVRHRYLASVGFTVRYDDGTGRQRRGDAAPMVAGLIANSRFKATLLPLTAGSFSPRLSAAALAAVASGGHLVAYTSIRQGPALWHAVTGDADWPVSTVRAFQEIARALYETLEPIIGQNGVDTQALHALLAAAFGAVIGSQVTRWQLELSGDELLVDLDFRPWGEVRVVRAQLTLGTPVTDQNTGG